MQRREIEEAGTSERKKRNMRVGNGCRHILS
jgi:hypothetical protein